MVMLAVNGKLVFGRPFDDVSPSPPDLSHFPRPQVMEVIKVATRPMKMIFVPSPDKQVTFDAPPTDLVLGRIEVAPAPPPSLPLESHGMRQGYVMVAAFRNEIGPAQEQGGIFPGIVILQVLPPLPRALISSCPPPPRR
jgi:hypothetical protein